MRQPRDRSRPGAARVTATGPLAVLSLAAAAAIALLAAAAAPALPQQQGSVDLLSQADGQWQGPGAAQGGSATGTSLAGLPDVFRAGRSAVAIGAPEASPGGRQSAGSVYVVAGMPGRGAIDLTALNGRGYRIDGAAAGDELGFALTSLTLPNGHPALAIGAPYASLSGRAAAGKVYVIDLRRLRANVDLGSPHLARAVVGVLTGPAACADTGYALGDAGPVRARRGDALLVGSPGDDPAGCPVPKSTGAAGGNRGAAMLVLGGHVASRVDLGRPGAAAATFTGAAAGDRAGSAVAGAGGGFFTVGAPQASPGGRAGAGAVYLLHGGRPGATTSLAGATTFAGAAADDQLGFALASTVRIAGRARVPQLVLGAPQASPGGRTHAGSVYVLPRSGEPPRTDLHAFTGRRIDGASPGDEAGWSLAGVGDLNGDGRPDLAIGAPYVASQTGQDRIDNGAAYVVYGGPGRTGLNLGQLRSRGFVVFGARNSDEAGSAVAPVADENGDGRPDLLIGAPYAENTTTATPTVGGTAYVIFGFGSGRLRYRPSAETVTAGQRLRPLVPLAQATGRPAFSVSPALPAGVSINPATGRIAGAPRARGRHVYTVQMADLAGVASARIRLDVR